MNFWLLREHGCVFCDGEDCGDTRGYHILAPITAETPEESIEATRLIAYREGFQGKSWEKLRLVNENDVEVPGL